MMPVALCAKGSRWAVIGRVVVPTDALVTNGRVAGGRGVADVLDTRVLAVSGRDGRVPGALGAAVGPVADVVD
jgi:hypothetical protein